MISKISAFKKQLAESQMIVFFGGAGVSTESGIPDFRSSKGLYSQGNRGHYSAEELVSYSFYKRYPDEFFAYYFEHLVFEDAEPNAGHLFLKELEETGKAVHVITQNIDGLHQRAGSSKVYELHGSVLRNHCTKCGKLYDLNELKLDTAGIPRCPLDNAIVRPDVVLYEENLDQNTMQGAISAIKRADMLIVAGTSLSVYPAAGLLRYFNGEHLVAINKSPISVPEGTLIFEDSIGNVLAGLQNS